MSLYQWLIALHVTGAFFVIGGSVIAATLNVMAQRRERPSEVALFLGLTRIAVVSIGIGFIATFLLGLWLVHEADFSYGDAWVIVSLILWFASAELGRRGGERDRHTRLLAERLASEGDAPSPELRARLRDPVTLALSWGSGVAVLVILALMIWKPGS